MDKSYTPSDKSLSTYPASPQRVAGHVTPHASLTASVMPSGGGGGGWGSDWSRIHGGAGWVSEGGGAAGGAGGGPAVHSSRMSRFGEVFSSWPPHRVAPAPEAPAPAASASIAPPHVADPSKARAMKMVKGSAAAAAAQLAAAAAVVAAADDGIEKADHSSARAALAAAGFKYTDSTPRLDYDAIQKHTQDFYEQFEIFGRGYPPIPSINYALPPKSDALGLSATLAPLASRTDAITTDRRDDADAMPIHTPPEANPMDSRADSDPLDSPSDDILIERSDGPIRTLLESHDGASDEDVSKDSDTNSDVLGSSTSHHDT